MKRAAVLVLAFALCASFCLTQLSEVDLHWHLLAGSRILEEHRVPRFDDFSFASAGRPWIDLHWLFQVLVAWVHRWAGWAGLDALKVLLVAGGFSLSALAALRRVRPIGVALLLLVGVVASQERFTLRPEAASFLLLGGLLLLLTDRRRHPRCLFLVPPLMAMWANLHALYAVGVAVLLIVLAGDLIAAVGRRPRDRSPALKIRPVLLATAAALPATLATPYGLDGWRLPLKLLSERIATRNLYGRSIAEFQAPFGGFGWTASITAFAILIAIITLTMILHGRRNRAPDLLLLIIFLALALMARRNIPLFALVALPAAAPALNGAFDRARERLASAPGVPSGAARAAGPALILAIVAAACFLLADVWSNRFFARDGTQRYFGSGEAPGFYPAGAAEFVKRERISGAVLNDMTMGGYLAWRWYPQRRIFIDGRLEVHDPSLYATYLRLQQDPKVFETVVRRYGIGAVLWSHRESPGAAPLLRYLSGGHSWRPVYVDLAASLFMREPGDDRDRPAPPAVDLKAPQLGERVLAEVRAAVLRDGADPAPAVLRRLLPLRSAPVALVNAGLFFAVIAAEAPAELLLRAALEQAPRNALIHYDLGLVLAEGRRAMEARHELDSAVALDGSLAPAHVALAGLLLRSGDAEAALRQWTLAERLGPLDGASLRARGVLRARRGRIDEAIEDYRQAILLEPGRADLRADLALLYDRRGLKVLAAEEIRQALQADPSACPPRAAQARVLAGGGDVQGAEAAYRQILVGDSACVEAHLGLAILLAANGRVDEAVHQSALAVGNGLDPAALSEEPALRILADRPDFRVLLTRGPQGPQEGRR